MDIWKEENYKSFSVFNRSKVFWGFVFEKAIEILLTKINGPENLSCITSLRTREEGKYIVIEKLKENIL